MAAASLRPLLLLLRFLVLLGAAAAAVELDGGKTSYTHVFSFGDSLADTGNGVRLPGARRGSAGSLSPYGMTYFHRPTGRASDGRLTVDFIVEALKAPFLTPYLAGDTAEDFRYGANFAVGGATAHGTEFFGGVGLKPFVPVSLATEMGWFKEVMHLLGSSPQERERITASSLFIVWEIGGNDFLIAFSQNRTLEEAKTFVPGSIDTIHSSLKELIGAGAKTVVVQGMLPLGCEPRLLELFKHGRRAGDYDPESGCLRSLNGLAEEHNAALTRALDELRQAHPGTAIVYADYYRAVADIAASPRKYGFGGSPLFACCGGGGGPYNVNLTAPCGSGGSTACDEPWEHVSWDGVHYTEAANRVVARGILCGPYANATPPLSSSHACVDTRMRPPPAQ